jgi:hypothetical protein
MDIKIISDIDECSTYTNICGRSDVQCTNTDGSYTCSCNTGYILYNNSCTGKLFTNGNICFYMYLYIK